MGHNSVGGREYVNPTQQDKADAQRDAAKKEAEAEGARSAAKANEAREASEQ
jgi:hypothetical protein